MYTRNFAGQISPLRSLALKGRLTSVEMTAFKLMVEGLYPFSYSLEGVLDAFSGQAIDQPTGSKGDRAGIGIYPVIGQYMTILLWKVLDNPLPVCVDHRIFGL